MKLKHQDKHISKPLPLVGYKATQKNLIRLSLMDSYCLTYILMVIHDFQLNKILDYYVVCVQSVVFEFEFRFNDVTRLSAKFNFRMLYTLCSICKFYTWPIAFAPTDG